MSLYRNQLNNFLKDLHIAADTIFEIGAGKEEARIKNKVNTFIVKDYITFDIDANTNPDRLLDLNEPLPPDFFQPNGLQFKNKADIIFCLEVFEYIWNPLVAIENISLMLKNDGLAYITFPTNYPLHNPVDIDYLRYSLEWITKIGLLYKLNIIQIINRKVTKGIQSLHQFWKEEGMHAAKDQRVDDLGYIIIFKKVK